MKRTAVLGVLLAAGSVSIFRRRLVMCTRRYCCGLPNSRSHTASKMGQSGSNRARLMSFSMMATRPPGYVVYPGYAQPVYGPGCYWASQPVYDPYGRVVGYTGQPVQICPGY